MTAKEIVKLAFFEGKQIRKIIHVGEWWFSVIDAVEVLTESPTPRQYWGKVKKREFTDLQLSPVWVQLKLEATDGKKYATDGANTKDLFRIIQ
jgi:DNA-damage-inducible protein D